MEATMYYVPPPWGYPQNQPNDDHFKRGLMFAAKLAQREEREKERKKNNERRLREQEAEKRKASRGRTLTLLELYILGIISYPFVMPLYNMALAYLQK